MDQLISFAINFILKVISGLGYPGVALLMAVQTMAVPIPSEVILPFAGSLVVSGHFTLFRLALVGAIGSMAGGLAAYSVGRQGGRPLVERYGKRLLISKRDLHLAEKFLSRYGTAAVFFGMMLPVFRSVLSFPAGILRMPVKRFVLMVFMGSFFWSLLLGYIGMKLGENWGELRNRFQGFDSAVAVIVVLGIVLWVLRHARHLKHESKK